MNGDRSNVLPFEKPVRRDAEGVENDAQEAGECRQITRTRIRDVAKRSVFAMVIGMWAALIYVLFFVLLLLRRPIRFLLGLASGVGLISFLMILLAPDATWKTKGIIMSVTLGLGSMALMWFYDSLLLRLAPEPIILTD